MIPSHPCVDDPESQSVGDGSHHTRAESRKHREEGDRTMLAAASVACSRRSVLLVPGPDTTAPAGGDDEETRSEVREAPGEIAEALGAAEQGDGEITNAPGEGARASRVGEEALARGDQAFDQLPAPPGLTAEVGNGDR
jgi:hypothetical protein